MGGGRMAPDNEAVHQLSTLTVLDEKGQSVPLSSLWQQQRTVLLFVRHFG